MTAEGLDGLLAAATIDPAVHALRPDYLALLVAAAGLPGGPSNEASDGWLREAEAAAVARLAGSPLEERPHVALWREAFRAFGAKPQRTRSSLEALLRRVPDGLPRINRLTDLYNAVSVLYEVPVGGEDLDAYVGPARLVRATATAAGDDLERRLCALDPAVITAHRLLAASHT